VRHTAATLLVLLVVVPSLWFGGPVVQRWWMLRGIGAGGVAEDRAMDFIAQRADEPAVTSAAVTRAGELPPADRGRVLTLLLLRAEPMPRALPPAVEATLREAPAAEVMRLVEAARLRGLHQPTWTAAAASRLPGLSAEHADALLAQLDHAGWWRRADVPDGAWVWWLHRLANSPNEVGRRAAAVMVADQPADDAATLALLGRLIADTEASVRYEALLSAAELAGATRPPEDSPRLHQRYVDQVAAVRGDADADVARMSWLVLGVLDPVYGYRPDLAGADPRVREAMAWAAVRTGGGSATVYELLEAEGLLHTLPQFIFEFPPFTAVDGSLVMGPDWLPQAPLFPSDEQLIEVLPSTLAATRDSAAVFLSQSLKPTLSTPLARRLMTSFDADARLGGAMLAALAGVHPQRIAGGAAYVLRDRPGLDMAGLEAMSDEQLAELGLHRVDLLRELAENEPDWADRQVLRVASWARGDEAAAGVGDELDALLARDDVSLTTVVLAMLHRGEHRGLDRLLTARRPVPGRLAELLGGAGWQWVLDRYLPEGAPRVPVLGDASPEARRLGADALRAWWHVERRGLIEDGASD
jgi:hypothetical protein